MSSVDELPIGTVTFLFTDIEGSTQLLKQLGGDRYGQALADHQRILREVFAEHGGQVLVSQTARDLVRDDPIPEVSLRDLGEHQLKDLDEPERLYQLVAPG